MNSLELTTGLMDVLALTEQMMAHAQQQEWDPLLALQQQRDLLLSTLFPLQEIDNSDSSREVLQQIITLNQQLEDVCKKARQALSLEMRGLNKNKKAVAAYQTS